MNPVNVPAKYEVRSFTRSCANRGYSKNLDSPWIRPRPFSHKFLMGFVGMDLVNVSAKIAVHSFSRSWDNSDCSFGLGLRTPNLEEGEAIEGRGWYRSKERLWVPTRPPIVTFHLSLRVSEIFPLLCSSTPLFPTPPLVSPKFPHVHLLIGGWPLAYEERRCWADCPCN